MIVLDEVTRDFGATRAVDGVSLEVARGRALGLVGGSGSGKSTIARMVCGLIGPGRGRVCVEGRDVAALRGASRRRLYRTVQMVFQDPGGSLNPRHTVGAVLEAPLKVLHGMTGTACRRRIGELLHQVALDEGLVARYPHELSGGQAQRVAIARALAAEPAVLVLDEPTSALDVTVQAEVVRLLHRLRADLGLTYLFISHDLALVEALCDAVAVLHDGRVVEHGPCRDVLARPRDDYTRALIAAVPALDTGGDSR